MNEDMAEAPAWHAKLREQLQDDTLATRIGEEILFNRLYIASFNHGTGDHLARITIAILAQLLDEYCKA